MSNACMMNFHKASTYKVTSIQIRKHHYQHFRNFSCAVKNRPMVIEGSMNKVMFELDLKGKLVF